MTSLQVLANTHCSKRPAESPERRRQFLMLTHRVPFPPDRGDRIRSWNLLLHLARIGDVSLGCVTEEPVADETRTKLNSVCDKIAVVGIGPKRKWINAATSAMKGRSLTEGLFWSRSLSQTLKRWATEKQFDAVLVYCSGMLRYTHDPLFHSIPQFVDLVDVDSQKFFEYSENAPVWKRHAFRMEGRRVRQLEREAAQQARAITLVSDSEATLFRKTLGDDLARKRCVIQGIPNGVDANYFHPRQTSERKYEKVEKPGSPSLTNTPNRNTKHPRLIFVGVMNYPPNIEAVRWFLDHVWSSLRERWPELSFEIVGKHPTASVSRMGRIPGVHVVGAVPDVRPFLNSADIVVAPLQLARGVQNKVLEAMAMGRPVVASSAASEGIEAESGKHFLVAHSPEKWISSITNLLCNDQLRRKLSLGARELVLQRYAWAATLSGFDRLFEKHLGPIDKSDRVS